MAVIDIASKQNATDNGWVFHGTPSGSDWWGEKRVQGQGKILAVAATSAALVTAISEVEKHHGRLGAKSPEFDKNAGTFKGTN